MYHQHLRKWHCSTCQNVFIRKNEHAEDGALVLLQRANGLACLENTQRPVQLPCTKVYAMM